MALIKWLVANAYADYAALESKDTNALYFIEETGEIYRGAKSYTEAVVFYNTDGAGTPARPTAGAAGKIYVDKTTGEGFAWNGTEYVQVVRGVDTAVTESSDKLITSGAVKTYVDTAVEAAKGEVETVTDKLVKSVAWNETNKTIDVTLGDDSVSNVSITKVATSLEYASGTGILTLKDAAGTALNEINLPLEQFVQSGRYDADSGNIVLVMNNSTEIEIPATALVDVYTGAASDNVTVNVSDLNVITATVKVDPVEGNLLQSTVDGLKVMADTTKMDKLQSATPGMVVVVAADGANVTASTVKVGGEALEGTPAATTLATEKAVADAIAAAVADVDFSAYVAKTDISTSIPATGAVDTKVVSEKAVADALTWQVVPTAAAEG